LPDIDLHFALLTIHFSSEEIFWLTKPSCGGSFVPQYLKPAQKVLFNLELISNFSFKRKFA
jgi:hypothetical protein